MHIFKAREWNPLSPGGSLSDIKHLPELRGINPGVWTTVNSYHSNQLSLLHPSSFPLMSPHPTSGFGEMRILGKGRISALLPGCFLFAPSPHAQAFAQHPTRPISYAYLEPPPPTISTTLHRVLVTAKLRRERSLWAGVSASPVICPSEIIWTLLETPNQDQLQLRFCFINTSICFPRPASADSGTAAWRRDLSLVLKQTSLEFLGSLKASAEKFCRRARRPASAMCNSCLVWCPLLEELHIIELKDASQKVMLNQKLEFYF